MSQYDDIIQAAAKKYNVDPGLIRGVIATESAGKPDAASSVGATGLMQIMPSNYKALGITDPKNPTQNIMGGTQLLSQLLDRYGDPTTALRHYQGGDDQSQWGPVNAAYPAKVFSAGGIGSAPQAAAAPKTLPGIPVGQQAGAQSDDAIFSAFSGGAPAQSAPQGGQSDDAIFAAMTRAAPTPAPATQAPAVSPSNSATAAQAPGMLTSFGAGLGRGVQEVALGGQQLLGKTFQGPSQWAARKLGLDSLGDLYQKAGDYLTGNASQGLQQGSQQVAPYQSAHPTATGVGQLTGAMAATGPLAEIAPAGAGLLGLMGRGAVSGSAMGAVSPVDPNSQDFWQQKAIQAGAGAALGAASPLAVSGISALGGYAGNALGSVFRPFTAAGRQQIAQQVVSNAAKGAPTTMDLREIIPGSVPTLAEATGNPGIATLQRTFRDLNPAPFVAREQQNSAARLSGLQEITGTPEDLLAARASRDTDAAANYLSTQVGIPTSNTGYAALKQTPAFQAAFKQAQTMAKNAGTPSIETVVPPQPNAGLWGKTADPQTYVSGTGLHWVKTALDDQINSAAQSGEKAKASNLLGVKDQLLGLMDQEIPGYAQARGAYAAASQPIDAMQYLQGMNLTDAQGNITLAKVQNALSGIQRAQQKPGVNLAKSVDQSQIDALTSIRDDLLRSTNTGLGRSAGSNTAQNLASQQSVASLFPGKLGTAAAKLPPGSIGSGIGGLVGFGAGGAPGAAVGAAIGSRLGSGLTGLLNTRNEAIQNEVTNLLLNPSMVTPTLNGATGRSLPLAGSVGLQRLLYPAAINGGLLSLRSNRGAQ